MEATAPSPYLHDEVDVHGEGLHSVEACDQGDGQEALRVHLPPQEEVSLQVVKAEVILSGKKRKKKSGGRQVKHLDLISKLLSSLAEDLRYF